MGQKIEVPYGNGTLSCTVSDTRKVQVLRPLEAPATGGLPESAIIQKALAAPIGSPRLSELARGKKRVVILTSDHTRPVPSGLTLPAMLAEIRRGSPDADITILIAVGSHRASTQEEMILKFGADLVAGERILNHDPRDQSNLVSLGKLPSGGELVINRLAVQADLLVADGFIEPHQFAGFSGGPKSVLPGIASLVTVFASHNAEFTIHPLARPGVLEGNPIHIDMVYAARRAKLAFILNVALSPRKQVIVAFAGDMEHAHRVGCDYVLAYSGVNAVPAPLVITSNGGYPLDQNIYQATKSIMTADLTCTSEGVIIAVNECRDGHGAEGFYQTFKNASSLEGLLAEIQSRGREDTMSDQWVTQLTGSILQKRTIIFVTAASRELIAHFRMKHASTLDEGIRMAETVLGKRDVPITVLPDAVSLVVRPP